MMKTMGTRARLLAAIEDYLHRSGMSARTFGLAAVKDQNLVYHLRAGERDITLGKAEKVERYMLENPPPPAKKKKMADETRTAA